MRRVATFLRASGIEITFGKREGHDRDRTIIIAGSENTVHRQGPRINRRVVRTVIRHHKVNWTDSCGQRPARGARILLNVRLVSTSLNSKRASLFFAERPQ